jgi:hypothetical protein
MLRKEIEKKGSELLEKLLGGEKTPAEGEAPAEEKPAEEKPAEEKSAEEQVKDKLKDLFRN